MILKRKHDIFFEHFLLIAENIREAARLFRENVELLENTEAYAENIKLLEDRGDEYTHTIFKALNQTFITPLEREDIMLLTVKLDDVLDGMEACADLLDIYRIKEPDPYMRLFARIVENCTEEIVAAVQLLAAKKLHDIRRHTFRINDLEKEADQLYRESLQVLFDENSDLKKIIQFKEIYAMMESILDCCEDVANALEGIIMRS
ncbi:DUF47 domain-containing protein [Desulfofundulus sp. TPOSR]|uniref:Phosphate transport regulator n=1 Tax=Desulfofundulus kuznetsovii (strain DSM 6115 / VKM B-1805 / 17) TaxID=760568 RepID=A0AAU8PE08_DESK7|nr:DUF47 family protein [Desulfofundulus sp. TPOSR]AEG14002.1 putative phosphate transport regulator [Desulfofundulus kuznetsovii DSM 6115]NHM26350.1 DUF47 domain-containing protein [Desulfofundulus sp. TPOSR]